MHELTDTAGISYGVCQILGENMNRHHIAKKLVPRLLTNDQKLQHIKLCLELQEKANEDPSFICRVIMGDESWIYRYDPETKQQSSQWKNPQSPRAKEVWQVQTLAKSMLIVFFVMMGTVHHEFVPPKATVTSDFYCDVLSNLRENV
jgi:hypothetical protein